MHKHSVNAVVASLEVGERVYVETTQAGYPGVMRAYNPAPTRRPEAIRERRFTCTLMTAISHAAVGDTRLLVCCERVA